MTTKLFVALAVILVALVGVAAAKDSHDRDYLAIQDQYKKDYPSKDAAAGFDTKVQQLYPVFPAAKVGDTFRTERCISCHVPDIAIVGPQVAAQRLAQDFFKYEPNAQQIAKAEGYKSTPGSSAHPAVIDPALYGKYGASAYATVNNDGFTPYSVAVPGSSPPKTQEVKLPGPIPSFLDPAQNGGKSLGIDQVGCIVCHNGGRLSLTEHDAHVNLIMNPEYDFTEGAALYYKNCVACHGAQGEGGVGPPLNNQDRLGYFNEDYYYRCIEYGYTDFEHLGSVMPAWGSEAPDFHYDKTRDGKQPPTVQRKLSEDQIHVLQEFIRHWENYQTLP